MMSALAGSPQSASRNKHERRRAYQTEDQNMPPTGRAVEQFFPNLAACNIAHLWTRAARPLSSYRQKPVPAPFCDMSSGQEVSPSLSTNRCPIDGGWTQKRPAHSKGQPTGNIAYFLLNLQIKKCIASRTKAQGILRAMLGVHRAPVGIG
jgi:hypothetical protein